MPNSVPITSHPKDVKLLRDGNGSLKQIMVYGEDGNPFVNIDFGHDHDQGDPHYHSWDSLIQGIPTHINRHRGLPVSLQLDVNFLWEKRGGLFHDGILTEAVVENEKITLHISDINKVQSTIILDTCIHKSVIGKGSGIIYEFIIAKGGNWRQTMKSASNDNRILLNLTGLTGIDHRRKDIEDRIRTGDLNLVLLFPSFGPEIIALCKEIRGLND